MLTKPFKSKVIMKVRTDHLQTDMYVAASIPPQEKLSYILLLNKLDIFIMFTINLSWELGDFYNTIRIRILY